MQQIPVVLPWKSNFLSPADRAVRLIDPQRLLKSCICLSSNAISPPPISVLLSVPVPVCRTPLSLVSTLLFICPKPLVMLWTYTQTHTHIHTHRYTPIYRHIHTPTHTHTHTKMGVLAASGVLQKGAFPVVSLEPEGGGGL